MTHRNAFLFCLILFIIGLDTNASAQNGFKNSAKNVLIFAAGESVSAKTPQRITVNPSIAPSANAKELDLTGSWNMTAQNGDQSFAVKLELKQSGNAFTGKVGTDLGNGVIENGKVDGDKFTATVKIEIQGQPLDLLMQGKGEGDKIDGIISNDVIGNIAFTAVKATADSSKNTSVANIAGKWNMSVNAGGTDLVVTLDFKQTESTFSGTLSSVFGDGIIENGKITGDKLTATARVNAQGQEMELKLDGTIEGGNKMSGTLTGNSIGSIPFSAIKSN